MLKKLIVSIIILWVCCCAANATVILKFLHRQPFDLQTMVVNGSSTNFAYNHADPNSPSNWEQFAPECGNKSQSPINLQTRKTKKLNRSVGTIAVTKWTDNPISYNITNNGHTIIFRPSYMDRTHPSILFNSAIYQLVQFHFHFNFNRKDGTEHHINDRAYSMECHAAFFNLNYETFENALEHADGLIVLARLFDEDDRHIGTNTLNFEFLQLVRNPGDTYILNVTGVMEVLFSLSDLLGPLNGPYFMYHGSLTTPDCNEVVTWIVLAKISRISGHNLFQFRQLGGNKGLLAPNIRPLQPLNGRTVYYYKGSLQFF